MIASISIFVFLINIMLIALIIVLAVTKKLNVLLWVLLSVGGYISFQLLLPLLTYILYSSKAMYGLTDGIAAFISFFIPFFYLVVLLIIALLRPSQKAASSNYQKCHTCGGVIKNQMQFCPYCGNDVTMNELKKEEKRY